MSALSRIPRPVRTLGGLALTIAAGAAVISLLVSVLLPVTGDTKGAGTLLLEESADPKSLPPLAEPSLVFAADGTFLAKFRGDVDRQPVSLSIVPEVMRRSVMAAEDDNFYEHKGVDLRSVGRALLSNLDSGGIEQGGSTITQQVVKQSFFINEKTGLADETLERKVKEAVMATRLEHHLTKDQILERYLNTVYLGWGAYGIQAATRLFYNKDVQQLTLGEASMLAGLVASPSRFDPYAKVPEAAARRLWVLRRMQKLGWIDEAQVVAGNAEPLPTQRFRATENVKEQYFVEAVKQTLLKDPILPVKSTDPAAQAKERYDTVFKGGLRIYTTLDPRLQRIAEAAVQAGTPANKRYEAALVSVDVKSGAVRAIYGGDNFKTEQFNLAMQGKRNPGSTFKVFGAVAALERGYSPFDTYDGSSGCRYKLNGKVIGEPVSSGGGPMSLWDGLYKSVNCVFVNLINTVGVEAVNDTAGKLGVDKTKLNPYPSVILGGSSVSPLDMASGFATIAADGVRHQTHIVERVTDAAGNPLYTAAPGSEQVIDRNNALMTLRMMKDVLTKGTAAGQGIGRPAAGKTGTTNRQTDAWFVGVTPQLSTAVWTGDPTRQRPYAVSYGAQSAQPIWRQFMREASEPWPVEDWAAPDEGKFRRGRSVGTFVAPPKPKPKPGAPAAPARPAPASTPPP